jgi:hypothetical protein
MKCSRLLVPILALILTFGAMPAEPQTTGMAGSHTLQAAQFSGFSPTDCTRLSATGFGARYCDGAACSMYAGLFLPAGALVSSVELEACDTDANDPGNDVTATLYQSGKLESSLTVVTAIATDGSPGCTTLPVGLAPWHPIDNVNNTYFVKVDIIGGTVATRFQAVRVHYYLQVSPAPATASFTDVPLGSSFFQFVEALAASKITAGCGGGLFCPDHFVTRGQLAVFLSKALGLSFAP